MKIEHDQDREWYIAYLDGKPYLVDEKLSNIISMREENIYANKHLRINWQILKEAVLPDGAGTESVVKAPRGIYLEKRNANGGLTRFTLLEPL